MRADFETYSAAYADFAYLDRRDGLLEVRLHSNDRPCVFDGPMHGRLGDLFSDIGSDAGNRVIILTATGDRFMVASDMDTSAFEATHPYTPEMHLHFVPESMRLIQTYLDIEVPVIAAINGPISVHAEIPVLSDIVLASDDCHFSDPFHFKNHIVPGDGVQVIWPIMMGLNRARHFLLTAAQVSAQEAHTIGFVNEVLSRDALMTRARELGRQLLDVPDTTLRATRVLFTRTLKRAIMEDLPLGLAMEGLGNVNYWPRKLSL